jgi:hypothetical protein
VVSWKKSPNRSIKIKELRKVVGAKWNIPKKRKEATQENGTTGPGSVKRKDYA